MGCFQWSYGQSGAYIFQRRQMSLALCLFYRSPKQNSCGNFQTQLVQEGRSMKQGCFNPQRGVSLPLASQVSILPIRSISYFQGSYLYSTVYQRLGNMLGNLYWMCFQAQYNSRYFRGGVPKILMIQMSCSCELSPGNIGYRVSSSTMMQPADHTSISVLQSVDCMTSSGALQYLEQMQETLLSSFSRILAEPKSQILSSQVWSLMSTLGGLRSLWQILVNCMQQSALKSWKVSSLRMMGGKGRLYFRCSLIMRLRLEGMNSMMMLRQHYCVDDTATSRTSLRKYYLRPMMLQCWMRAMIPSYLFLQRLSWRTYLSAHMLPSCLCLACVNGDVRGRLCRRCPVRPV